MIWHKHRYVGPLAQGLIEIIRRDAEHLRRKQGARSVA
jgi:hypothetical protein